MQQSAKTKISCEKTRNCHQWFLLGMLGDTEELMNPTGSRFGVAASPHCSRFAMDFSRLDAICQEAVVDENKRITLGYIGYIYMCICVIYVSG
jgi:hypothetical protein